MLVKGAPGQKHKCANKINTIKVMNCHALKLRLVFEIRMLYLNQQAWRIRPIYFDVQPICYICKRMSLFSSALYLKEKRMVDINKRTNNLSLITVCV